MCSVPLDLHVFRPSPPSVWRSLSNTESFAPGPECVGETLQTGFISATLSFVMISRARIVSTSVCKVLLCVLLKTSTGSMSCSLWHTHTVPHRQQHARLARCNRFAGSSFPVLRNVVGIEQRYGPVWVNKQTFSRSLWTRREAVWDITQTHRGSWHSADNRSDNTDWLFLLCIHFSNTVFVYCWWLIVGRLDNCNFKKHSTRNMGRLRVSVTLYFWLLASLHNMNITTELKRR